jgi:hypothetical protein
MKGKEDGDEREDEEVKEEEGDEDEDEAHVLLLELDDAPKEMPKEANTKTTIEEDHKTDPFKVHTPLHHLNPRLTTIRRLSSQVFDASSFSRLRSTQW